MADKPSLPALEHLIARRRNAEALQIAINILQAIDGRAGRLDSVVPGATYPGGSEEDAAIAFATRFAAAFGRLMTEPDLEISAANFEHLLTQHRWIDLIFSLSGFRTSDSFLPLIAKNDGNGRLSFEGANLLRLLALLTMNSFVDVDFDKFWRANRAAVAVAFLNYISSRYVFSRRAFDFRERLLEWIPTRLAEVKLGAVMLARLPEIYMHCSYAVTANKHAIKRPLLEQVRRACLEAGVVENTDAVRPRRAEGATVVVVGEQFFVGHAVHRSHSRAVQSLRGNFNLIGVVHPSPIGTPIADLFDETIAVPRGDFLVSVRTLAAEIVARKPDLILYLGVGMIPTVIALASLRLAPIQCASFGHTATTMSPTVDYFILPKDFVASPDCFSEQIVALPREAMPFTPRQPPPGGRRQPSGAVIQVGIPASTMKLNPALFDAITRIDQAAKADVIFHFFPLAATGLPYFELSRVIRGRIPRARVHPQLPYENYMEQLAQCDLFLCPFPYGNMNSIIDSFQLGLPGVCLDGPEAHSHADAAFFARIKLPEKLTTKSVDEYVAAAVRLIDDRVWRNYCVELVRKADLNAAFFKGDAGLFCKAIEYLIWPPER